MARKATDLLDIFNYASDDGDGGKSKRPRKPSRSKKKKKNAMRKKPAAARSNTSEAFMLHRRQLVLGGSVLALLLILSFVLGVAAGRPDSGDEGGPELLRPTGVYIYGRLPKVDNLTAQPTRLDVVQRDLVKKHGIRPGLIRTRQTPDRYDLYLGPFATKAEARTYFERLGLDRVKFLNGAPFMPPRFGRLP